MCLHEDDCLVSIESLLFKRTYDLETLNSVSIAIVSLVALILFFIILLTTFHLLSRCLEGRTILQRNVLELGEEPDSQNPPNRPQVQGSFGRAVATGVRTLVSCLPGSKLLKPVADFVLKGIGLTSDHPVNGIFANVANTALGAKFVLAYSNILVGTKLVTYRGRTEASKGNKQMFTIPFLDARLLEVVISVSPINIVSKRSGDWTVAFYPFYDQQDRDSFSVPDRNAIERELR